MGVPGAGKWVPWVDFKEFGVSALGHHSGVAGREIEAYGFVLACKINSSTKIHVVFLRTPSIDMTTRRDGRVKRNQSTTVGYLDFQGS